ncbi:hypothetical protein [Neglectibacter caecimuris]|uniref:hypothetical protein n=1 Tax=Neglectibacter caecimuris TaxID=3093658 RepID=UPI002AC8971F|nr:hypothetical protein [Neglectibacter sp. M00184]
MSDVEKRLCKLLLTADAIAILISMVAGPLNRTALALGAAASAILISLCLLVYSLYFWPRQR